MDIQDFAFLCIAGTFGFIVVVTLTWKIVWKIITGAMGFLNQARKK
jgi:hypothetical protein